jgi:hypothetical protein
VSIFAGILGRSSASPDDEVEAVAQARARHVANARANDRYWTELDEVDLVKRGPWLVSATTDELFTIYRGSVFGPYGQIEYDAMRELAFFVTRKPEDVVLLEKSSSPRTWSEVAYRRARAAS